MIATVRRGLPPVVLAVVLLAVGRPLPAVVLLVLAIALVGVGMLAPSVMERFDSAVVRFGVAIATVVSWVALTVVWALSVGPAWLMTRLGRRDVLRPQGIVATGGWAGRATGASAGRRTFVNEQSLGEVRRSRWGVMRLVPLVTGWVVVALVANYAVGWTYDELLGTHDLPDAATGRTGNVEDLAETPAMADAPWAQDYWQEFGALDYRYEPYVLTQVEDTDGPLVTVTDGVRRSYEPEGALDDIPEVWFFGGGATFGEGQRDEHTIPSAFARAAETSGEPVRVTNFAQPGHTTWQQWQHFERMLAVRPPPDLAVFLGGYDDIRVQLEGPTPDPTHYNVDGADQSLTGDPPPTDVGEVIEEYQDSSIITRLVRRMQSLVGTAGAAPAGGGEGPATFAADLHRRARLFLDYLGDRDNVEIVSAWQPEPVDGPVRKPFRDLVSASDEDVMDLSGLLDDRPDDYIDDSNVNEDGAGVVADALFGRLMADLAR